MIHSTPLLLLLLRRSGTQANPILLSAVISSRHMAGMLGSNRVSVRSPIHAAAGFATDAAPEEPGQPARKDRSRQLSSLQRYGRDLTAEARRSLLDPVIGRGDVIQRTLQVLLRRSKHNPLLIGEAGVGKTAIVEGIAQLMAAPEPLRGLADKRLIALDVAAVVAGSTYRGEFEERLQGLLHDCENAAGSVVLFIDEIHVLVGAGNTEGGLDFANMLKPALARSVLQVIGATTLDEYRQHIETDPALTRRFQPILVEEPSPQECVQLLTGLAPRYEAFHRVQFSKQALATAVTAAHRYIPERRLPDSAIDLIDEAAAKVRLAVHNAPQQQQQQPPDTNEGGSSSRWLSGLEGLSSTSGVDSNSSGDSSGSGESASATMGIASEETSTLDGSSGSCSRVGDGNGSSSGDLQRARHSMETPQHVVKSEGSIDMFAAQIQQEMHNIPVDTPAAAATGSSTGSQQQQQKQLHQKPPGPGGHPAAVGGAASTVAAAAVTSDATGTPPPGPPAAAAAASAPASWSDWITAKGWRGEAEVQRQQLLEWFGASPAQPLKGVLGHQQMTHERRKKHAELFSQQLAAAAAATGQHSRDGSSSSSTAAVRRLPASEAWALNQSINDIVNNSSSSSHGSASGVPKTLTPGTERMSAKPQQDVQHSDLQTPNPDWLAYDHSPRSCPHCGTLVAAPREQLRLQCPNCGFRFLNVAPEKLQLGTTVLLSKQQQTQQMQQTQSSQQTQQRMVDSAKPVSHHVMSPVITTVTSATATVLPKSPDRRAAVAVHEQHRDGHAQQVPEAATPQVAAAAAAEKRWKSGDSNSSSNSSRMTGGSAELRAHNATTTTTGSSSSGNDSWPVVGSSSSSSVQHSPDTAGAASRPVITAEDILEVVSEATGIPLTLLSTGIQTATSNVTSTQNNTSTPAFSASMQAAVQELATINATLTAAVLGQDAAAAAVIGALRLSRLGLHHNSNSSSNSLGKGGVHDARQGRLSLSLLLKGPSGVGKSLMAAVLASCLMPAEPQGILQLSCGELAERHSISRLIGAPPGYVGYGKGGLLTEAIRRRPHSVVVFDDVERAHPDVVGLLLQSVEEGWLMDSSGHSINLRSATYIFTANSAAPATTIRPGGIAGADLLSKQQSAVHQQLHQQRAVQQVADAAAQHVICSSSSASASSSSSSSSGGRAVRDFSTGGWGLEGAELEGDEVSENPSPAAASAAAQISSKGATATAPSSAAAAAARDAMVAELGSRVDDVILFQPLSPASMAAIVKQQLQQAAAVAQLQGVLLHVEDAAAEWLATAGCSNSSGARVLGQLIRRHVMVPLAASMMEAAAATGKAGGVQTTQDINQGIDVAASAALVAAGDTPGVWAVAVLRKAVRHPLSLQFVQL